MLLNLYILGALDGQEPHYNFIHTQYIKLLPNLKVAASEISLDLLVGKKLPFGRSCQRRRTYRPGERLPTRIFRETRTVGDRATLHLPPILEPSESHRFFGRQNRNCGNAPCRFEKILTAASATIPKSKSNGVSFLVSYSLSPRS